MTSSLLAAQVSWRAYRVWQRNLATFRTYWMASLVGNIGQPFFYLIGFGVGVGAYLTSIEGQSYIDFIAPGLVISTAMFAAVFECTFGSFTRLAEEKIFDGMLATPLSVGDVAAGEVLWGMTKGVMAGGAMLAIAAAFGLMGSVWIFLAIPLLFLVGFLFAAMALIVTALSPGYESFSYFFNLGIAPMFFLSGIFFPLTRLPEWVPRVTWFIPLYHPVEVIRPLAAGQPSLALWGHVLWLVVASALLLAAAISLMYRRIIR